MRCIKLGETLVKIAAVCASAALLALTFTAHAAEADKKSTASAPASMQREKLEEVSAAITSIDPATRMITLKADDGSTGSYEVGPEVKNFAQIKVGDHVVVSYYHGLAAEVKPAGTVRFTGSGEWRTETFQLPDAAFGNGQPGGSDFRLSVDGRGLAVRSVMVLKK